MKRLHFFLILLLFVPAPAGEPQVWSVDTRAEVLKGDADGVSISDTGAISIAPRLTEVYKTEQSYVWSSAVDAAGNFYLGTGGEGKVFKVDAAGKGVLLYDSAELNVTAIALGRSGEIFAGTSPDGKVYKIDQAGKAEVYFQPGEKYIWSLAVMADGSLAVGTGENGKIYRVRAAGAAPAASLLFDTSETHIISMAVDKNGNLYAGTDSSGLVLRFGADGKPFGLLDSPLREIHELAVGADGSVYALAIGESASAAKPAETTAAATPASATVSVAAASATPEPAPKSRYDLAGAKSAVYRIMPDGGNDLIWASTTVTGFSIYAHQTGSGVLLGTSDKGRIYSVSNDGRETLVLQSDAGQVSTIRSFGQNLYATSSNQGKLFRFGSETATEGEYRSPVLDAKAAASWGRIWWRSAGGVQLQTRTGNTERPDETWSAWSNAYTDQKGAQISSPKAKYLQWRAVLKSTGGAASLTAVNLAFIARNIAPEVLSINVLPTNVGLAANPPMQVDPNIELSGLDPATFGIPNAAIPPRRVYQRGATSLQWTAEDRNGDKMVYDLYYRETGESAFKLLRAGLSDTFLTIDGQALADGQYIFKVVAKDSPSNPAGLFASGERSSGLVDIDNTAPAVTAAGNAIVSGNSARVSFDAVDAASYIIRAEYSVNGGEWRAVYAEDGIADSPRERFTFDVAAPTTGEYAVTLRVFDVNGNSGNARVVIRR